MLIGSEGTLGVITEAWVRVRPRPARRSSRGVRFADFAAAAAAVRALSQSGLHPSNCRLLSAREAQLTGAGGGGAALLMLGFESARIDTEPWLELALECCAEHGGTWDPTAGPAAGPGTAGGAQAAVGSWREAFMRAPYLRDTFVAMGVLSETFETAITWDRFERFNASVLQSTRNAVRDACGEGIVTCRLTHVYPDGAAPYFTVLAPARRGEELAQWAQIKHAAAEAILAGGGTITHHHAVGRDHRPWYDRQRPEPFAAALAGAKAAIDPTGALNPGVLIDPA
jgi:alkyldihydroxyacetonephosphate synthase